jgi:hypothetical protein
VHGPDQKERSIGKIKRETRTAGLHTKSRCLFALLNSGGHIWDKHHEVVCMDAHKLSHGTRRLSRTGPDPAFHRLKRQRRGVLMFRDGEGAR